MNGKSKWNHTGTQDRTGDLQRARLTSWPLDHTRSEHMQYLKENAQFPFEAQIKEGMRDGLSLPAQNTTRGGI